MNDAAGVAQGVRREFDTLFRTQAERILRDLDVVKRDEFEAIKEWRGSRARRTRRSRPASPRSKARTARRPGPPPPETFPVGLGNGMQ